MVIAVVLGVGCLMVSSSVGAYFLWGRGDDSSGKDLPEVPVQAPSVVFKGFRLPEYGRDATLQDLINELFKVESNCKQMLAFTKVTLPRILVKYSSALDKVLAWIRTGKVPTKKTLEAYADILRNFFKDVKKAMLPLLDCDSSATFTSSTTAMGIEGSAEYPVRDYALKMIGNVDQALSDSSAWNKN